MNLNIPTLKCFVRLEHISRRAGMEEAYAFGLSSVKARSLGFHVMLKSGAHYRHVPLHALCTTPTAPARPLSELAYWDCFSSRPEVTVFEYLNLHQCYCFLPSLQRVSGTYLFTVDWLPDSLENPGFVLEPDQNKCGHVIKLEDGNICMLPTNRIAWRDGYFIGKDPQPQLQQYRVQQEVYCAERCERDFSSREGWESE